MTVDVIEAEFSDRRRAQECTAREELEARVAELERQVILMRRANEMQVRQAAERISRQAPEPHHPLEEEEKLSHETD